jgi:hypothetical protein
VPFIDHFLTDGPGPPEANGPEQQLWQSLLGEKVCGFLSAFFRVIHSYFRAFFNAFAAGLARIFHGFARQLEGFLRTIRSFQHNCFCVFIEFLNGAFGSFIAVLAHFSHVDGGFIRSFARGPNYDLRPFLQVVKTRFGSLHHGLVGNFDGMFGSIRALHHNGLCGVIHFFDSPVEETHHILRHANNGPENQANYKSSQIFHDFSSPDYLNL